MRPPPLPTARKRSDPLIGSLAADRYRILSIIGEGGMGRVYSAEHEAIQKKVALKILRPEFSRKPEIVSRFQQEAISASRIKHPNVLDVFDFGQLADGSFFLAMEYLEGIDLADELQQKRKIEARRGVRIALQICRALGAAHARGVVHRDMKPENVFLQHSDDSEEVVKILDFGIALLRTAEEPSHSNGKRRLTRTGMIFGTPEYMAPEQASGRKADLRVDVYAVGIIMFEMFTGAVPFVGDSFMGVLQAHATQPLPNMRALFGDLSISPQLQQVIERALAKNPEARFQSMNDFAAALLLTPEGARHGSLRPSAAHPAALELAPSSAHIHAAAPIAIAPLAPALEPGDKPPASGAGYPPPSAAGYPAPSAPGYPPPSAGGYPPPPVNTPPSGVGFPPPSGNGFTPESAAARAQTQLGAEALSPASFRPARRWPYVLLGLLALGGAAAAALTVWPGLLNGTTVGAAAAPGDVKAGEPTHGNTRPPSAAPAPDEPPKSELAAITRVQLHVATIPEGALVFKDGFQVCDSTPCDIAATPDETLILEARKGAMRGTAKVLAQRDQSVSIQLAQPASARSRSAAGKERLCEVEVDGLKILRPCK